MQFEASISIDDNGRITWAIVDKDEVVAAGEAKTLREAVCALENDLIGMNYIKDPIV